MLGDGAPGALFPILTMDDAELLQTFDTQIRRAAEPIPGYRSVVFKDPAPLMLCYPVADDARWGGGVFWSDLNESNADAAIAAALEWFQPLGREIEWKHYGYDQPFDLPDRLRAAGFQPEPEEALVVGEIATVQQRITAVSDIAGITIRRLREDEAGAAADWRGISELHRAVWDQDASAMNAAIANTIAADPSGSSMWLAVAEDGRVVCAGRVRFHEGTDLASLWGGSTLEQFRGRGIYKALVLRRVKEAAERGFRLLRVDASPQSRPILERFGLRTLTSTTPWKWGP